MFGKEKKKSRALCKRIGNSAAKKFQKCQQARLIKKVSKYIERIKLHNYSKAARQ